MGDRNSFVFYRSFKDSLKDLSNEDKLIMYEAICDYSLDQKEPQLTGFPNALFILIRPNLDANLKRWQNGCKGGPPIGSHNNPLGRKKAKLTESLPLSNQKLTKNLPNKDKDVDKDDNVDVNKKENIKKKILSFTERQKIFHDSLIPYIEQYGKDMIRAFYDYWSEPNVAKTKMQYELKKTWDMAGRLRTWNRRESNGK